MKLEEGPAFGALIIGTGVGYLVYRKTQAPLLSAVVGVGIGIADYILVIFIKNVTKK